MVRKSTLDCKQLDGSRLYQKPVIFTGLSNKTEEILITRLSCGRLILVTEYDVTELKFVVKVETLDEERVQLLCNRISRFL